MKTRIVLLSAMLVLSVTAFAQTEQGSYYISGLSSMSFSRSVSNLTDNGSYVIGASVDINKFRLQTEVGAFIAKDFALGLSVQFNHEKNFGLAGVPEVTKEILFMPCLLYIVPLKSQLRPYAQVGGGLATVTLSMSDQNETFSGFALAGVLGVKYFINETIALDFGISLGKTKVSSGDNHQKVSGESLAAGLGIGIHF